MDPSTVTVLNVDDHLPARTAVSDMLRDAGFTVVEAGSGREAIARLVTAPDLVILDLHLPDMHGLEVCRILRSRPETASTPVLMLSGVYTSTDDRSGGLESGAAAYLTKPVTRRELLATVDSLLRARRAEGQTRRRARQLHEAQDAVAAALLSETLDLREVFERLGEITRAVLDADVIRVRVVGRDGRLRLLASIGDARGSEAAPSRPSEAFLAAVLQQRATAMVVDATGPLGFADDPWIQAERVVSVMTAPMLVEDEAVGVLSCWSRTRREWSADDISHLETIARHASVAIRNARLYEASERRRRRGRLGRHAHVDPPAGPGREILDVSKLEAGKLALDCRPLDLRAAVADVVDRFGAAAEPKGIALAMTADDDADHVIRADAARVDQVLMNLVSNALKFTPPAGRIIVDLRVAADEVQVAVVDSGPGIAAAELPLLFEKFSQTSTGKAAGTAGSGLGLVICRQLVEAHGGRIWAESEPGHGARFAFRLPREGPGMPPA